MKRSNNSTSKILTLNFNQNNYQFSTELIKPLNTFYNEICSYLQINPDKFNLYYNNKKLITDSNNNITLSEIIKSNDDLFFKILEKKIKSKTPYKLNLRYDTLPLNEKETSRKKLPNFLTLSTKEVKPYINNKRYDNIYNKNNDNSCGVIISQIPSVKDIETILTQFNNQSKNSNFKTNNNFDKQRGILIALSNNSVRIDFQDEMILNQFISYISFIKYENGYFKNIIIQKDNSKIKNNNRNLSYSHKNVRSYLHNINNSNNINSFRNGNKNKIAIKINDVIKALKENELNNECYHGLSLKRIGEDEIITDYYKQQNFLRNSSPYISQEEKRILEEKENKKHFIDKHKNFITSVGKYSMKPNFIPNYVGMTPSENPKTHLFRIVDKKKWISNKGFNV